MLAAVFTGTSVMMLGQYFAHQAYPAPEGMDYQNAEQVKAYMTSFPVYVYLIMIVAHQAGTFAAAFLSARLDSKNGRKNALMMGVIFMMGGMMNLQALPHPIWMWGELPFYLISSVSGGILAMRYPDQRGFTAPQS